MGCSAQKDKVKEESPSGAASPAGVPAGRANKAVVSNGLEISLDLPGAAGLDISDLLFSSPPQPKKEASSEEEWENADTGEPVSAEKVRAKRFRNGRLHWEFLQQISFYHTSSAALYAESKSALDDTGSENGKGENNPEIVGSSVRFVRTAWLLFLLSLPPSLAYS